MVRSAISDGFYTKYLRYFYIFGNTIDKIFEITRDTNSESALRAAHIVQKDLGFVYTLNHITEVEQEVHDYTLFGDNTLFESRRRMALYTLLFLREYYCIKRTEAVALPSDTSIPENYQHHIDMARDLILPDTNHEMLEFEETIQQFIVTFGKRFNLEFF